MDDARAPARSGPASERLPVPVATGTRLPAISPAHARGLRRELFRAFESHAREHVPRLKRALCNVRHPYRSLRDLRAVLELACAAMRKGCHAYHNTEEAVFGLVLAPTQLMHANDGREEALMVQLIAMVRPGLRVLPYVGDCAVVGHHAVERMFQRLRTSCVQEVRDELLVACGWLMLLHRVLLREGKGAEVLQLPVPTRRGILLTARAPDTGRLNVRTFLLRGWDRRAEASIASLERWGAATKPDRAAENVALEALFAAPENAWWFHPHLPRTSRRDATGQRAVVAEEPSRNAIRVAFRPPGS